MGLATIPERISAEVIAKMGLSDEIGTRGEALFVAAIMNFCGRERPLFYPHFLGEKFETLDYLVELVGIQRGHAYLFVQVKTTRLGFIGDSSHRRLRVNLSGRDAERMRRFPAPTYLVGIDERQDQDCAFILSIDENVKTPLSGMPTKYPLDCRNLRVLWDEVQHYWRTRDMQVRSSAFSL